MEKLNKGFLQVGLVIVLASIVAAVLVSKYVNISYVEAVKGGPTGWLKKKIEKCAENTPTWICKGITNNSKQKDPENRINCQPKKYEGCLIDYLDDSGQFCYAVRNPNCGSNNVEEQPTPTPTPTPTSTPISTPTATPTATPTSTPISTPTSSSTPTATPTITPPPVLGVTAPPVLPKTGGEVGVSLSLFGITVGGIYIFKKFKLI